MASPEVIDVDADEPPRITGGTGKPDAPLEIASSDSEDENPAKRAKLAPVTPLSPAGPPSPSGNALCAQLRREREARRPPRPAPVAPLRPPRQTSIETFELSAATQSARDVPGRIDRGYTKVVDGVLTTGDAAVLIRLAAQQGYKVATIKGQTQSPAARQKALKKRNGLRCMVNAPRLVDQIFDRLRPFLPARKRDGNGAEWRLVGLNERLRFLRYDPGQFFLQHPDGHFSRGRRKRSFITCSCTSPALVSRVWPAAALVFRPPSPTTQFRAALRHYRCHAQCAATWARPRRRRRPH